MCFGDGAEGAVGDMIGAGPLKPKPTTVVDVDVGKTVLDDVDEVVAPNVGAFKNCG